MSDLDLKGRQAVITGAASGIGRMGTPEQVAAFAHYLCSDEASFITGADLPLDGGYFNLR